MFGGGLREGAPSLRCSGFFSVLYHQILNSLASFVKIHFFVAARVIQVLLKRRVAAFFAI